MVIKTRPDLRWSDVTPRAAYVGRREFLQAVGLAAAAGGAGLLSASDLEAQTGQKIPNVKKGPFGTDEALTPYKDVTTYNNFYEFGTDKDDPSRYAHTLKTRPWDVTIDGAVAKGGKFALDDLIKPYQLEERIYRMRCVEAWSMVIPWIGFPLGELLKKVEPTEKAKFVEFTTLRSVEQMPGQRSPVLEWPYKEGLRLDEAMHPLTILVVRIRLVESQPHTAWMDSNSSEYGFYSNVNPEVDHPRWTQAKERRIGEFFKRPTLMFNGYGDQVASLYSGMDLRKNY